MVAPSFVLVLVLHGAMGSVSVASVSELVYDKKGCTLAGEAWKASKGMRDYFCLPTPTISSPYLEK
jgi:hypothetical protein